jgi:hypothetical protein
MDLRFPTRPVSLWLWMAAALFTGCSDAVQLTHETETGGVVTYLYKEDRGGPMGSPHRKAALKLMDTKCPTGYIVLRDGEIKGYSSMSSAEGQEGEITGRRWGIQFRCK